MSTQVGSIHYDLSINSNEFDSQLKGISKKLKDVGDTMVDVGKKMTLGLTTPIVAGATISMKRASDLVETINKVDVAFGDNAKTVKEWGNTTLKSIGLAKGSALDMAALFGDMGTAMGQSTAQAAKMSMNLVTLAGDMASFKNLSFERVQTALAGIYTGETEALKSLGIVMTETNLTEFARAQGISKSIKEMTQAEKVQLRYNYVMSVTKNAQGDFTRTMSGTANQMRYTAERVKELEAQFGERLLPIMGKLLETANKLLDVFAKLTPKQQNVALAGAGIVAALGPMLIVVGSLVRGFSALIPLLASPVFWIVAAVLAVIAGAIYLVWKNWNNLVSFYNSYVAPMWQSFLNFLRPVITVVQYMANLFVQVLLPALQASWNFMVSQFKPAWDSISNAINNLMIALQPLMPVLDFIGKVILVALAVAIGVVVAVITGLITVLGYVVGAIARVVGWVSELIGWFFRLKSEAIQGVINAMQAIIGTIGNFIGQLWNSGARLIDGFINGIKDGFGKAVNVVRDGLGKIRKLLPFSPAKEGPFSGRGWTLYSGQSLMKGLADGIKQNSNLPQLALDNALAGAQFNINARTADTSPVSNTTISINGDITLGNRDAVNQFFDKLNRNNELAQKGMAIL